MHSISFCVWMGDCNIAVTREKSNVAWFSLWVCQFCSSLWLCCCCCCCSRGGEKKVCLWWLPSFAIPKSSLSSSLLLLLFVNVPNSDNCDLDLGVLVDWSWTYVSNPVVLARDTLVLMLLPLLPALSSEKRRRHCRVCGCWLLALIFNDERDATEGVVLLAWKYLLCHCEVDNIDDEADDVDGAAEKEEQQAGWKW